MDANGRLLQGATHSQPSASSASSPSFLSHQLNLCHLPLNLLSCLFTRSSPNYSLLPSGSVEFSTLPDFPFSPHLFQTSGKRFGWGSEGCGHNRPALHRWLPSKWNRDGNGMQESCGIVEYFNFGCSSVRNHGLCPLGPLTSFTFHQEEDCATRSALSFVSFQQSPPGVSTYSPGSLLLRWEESLHSVELYAECLPWDS